MADLLQTGAAFLADQFKEHCSKTVTYRRGAATATVKATVGRTLYPVDTGIGIVDRLEVRDYLIQAADLILSGDTTPTLPVRGDEIDDVLPDGSTLTSEVWSERDTPHWAYADGYRLVLRIHTRQKQT